MLACGLSQTSRYGHDLIDFKGMAYRDHSQATPCGRSLLAGFLRARGRLRESLPAFSNALYPTKMQKPTHIPRGLPPLQPRSIFLKDEAPHTPHTTQSFIPQKNVAFFFQLKLLFTGKTYMVVACFSLVLKKELTYLRANQKVL